MTDEVEEQAGSNERMNLRFSKLGLHEHLMSWSESETIKLATKIVSCCKQSIPICWNRLPSNQNREAQEKS